jgi:hypothetical protein
LRAPRALDLDALAPVATEGIRLLPVVHDRIEMTAVVRAALTATDPAGVAVELPATLQEAAGRAIDRLPLISLLVTREPGEDALVWVAAPGDPFVEAMRWAREHDRPLFFVDPDLPYAERHVDPIPDPYALFRLGPERYFEMLADEVGSGEGGEADLRREAGIAFHLRRARERLDGGSLLAFVGAAHVRRLRSRLGEPAAHPFARRRRSTVELRHLHPSSLTALLPDPPLAHAVWERVRGGRSSGEVGPTALEETLSRKVSVMRFGLRVIAGEGGEAEAERKRRLVYYAASQGTNEALFGAPFPDRHRLGRVVWRVAAGSYREQTDESTQPWQRRLFHDYASRCARVQGQLVPGLYEWAIAARGVGDDNLAWEVFDAARTYPWQEETAEIETASVDGDELDLGTRRIRFRRRFLRVKRRPVPVRRRPTPENPEECPAGFDSEGLCSYPPEDVVIEDYGRFLQRKAVSILSAEQSRTEPFTTSMLDGLDIRETLRNAHEGRIYVEERGRVPGEAGSVVVIFDRDRGNDRFPFAMTWLGEHDQESDMAFYSTSPAAQVVGPGIMRATYGGFMLTAPRGRLFDVWTDRDYAFARDKAEVLLMAAVDYSLEKLVVHVAEERPGERMRRYAADHGKRLLHVPLGSLSPVTLKKIRVLHILAGKDKRSIAESYVW